ncbi:MAG: ArsR/SmtB family transcription factor [Haloplanus sp.]
MAESIFPVRDVEPTSDPDPQVVPLGEADEIVEALASGTARRFVALLHEEPMVPSELAERAETSIQNVTYHLERLSDAGVVEVIGTRYSSRGTEMDVYAPASGPLVIRCGGGDEGTVSQALAATAASETGLANSD